MKLIDLTGRTFDRLTVIERVRRGRQTMWRCRCNCGAIKIVRGDHLKAGKIRSCGCFLRDLRPTLRGGLTHGGSKLPEYEIWHGMKRRCLDPNVPAFPDYGGRGIRVCDRWRDNFATFYADMGPRPSPEHEIDRIDNNGNYEPGNCRWATITVNCRNKRNNVVFEIDGISLTLVEWAERFGVMPRTIMWRLRKGWPLEKAVKETAHPRRPDSEETKRRKQAAAHLRNQRATSAA